MKISIALFLAVTSLASAAVAQSKKDKVEIGIQTTSLTLFHPDFPGDDTQIGIGGRVTYNFNRSLAAEAEINFFPQKQFFLAASGRAIQGQFGIKAGKRFEKFGLFAKARPGFLTLGDRFTTGPNTPFFKVERATLFAMDIGSVLELYPSRQSVVRFEAGDTAIRHPSLFAFPFPGILTPSVTTQLVRAAKFKHNFQFTAGVGFRLGGFPGADDDQNNSSADPQQRTPRFEIGAQFTSLLVERPTPLCPSPCLLGDDPIHVEPGVGARFTFNLTDNIALEGEGNYYTRDRNELPNPSGHMMQGQFGAKVGKRFEKWGVFGKGRPGFVGFTNVSELVGTRLIVFFGNTFEIGDFRVVKKFYPSFDVGGVVEFYISPRWMARFDIGDTIIRYGELVGPGFSLSRAIERRPPETKHNLQVTSGIGFRF